MEAVLGPDLVVEVLALLAQDEKLPPSRAPLAAVCRAFDAALRAPEAWPEVRLPLRRCATAAEAADRARRFAAWAAPRVGAARALALAAPSVAAAGSATHVEQELVAAEARRLFESVLAAAPAVEELELEASRGGAAAAGVAAAASRRVRRLTLRCGGDAVWDLRPFPALADLRVVVADCAPTNRALADAGAGAGAGAGADAAGWVPPALASLALVRAGDGALRAAARHLSAAAPLPALRCLDLGGAQFAAQGGACPLEAMLRAAPALEALLLPGARLPLGLSEYLAAAAPALRRLRLDGTDLAWPSHELAALRRLPRLEALSVARVVLPGRAWAAAGAPALRHLDVSGTMLRELLPAGGPAGAGALLPPGLATLVCDWELLASPAAAAALAAAPALAALWIGPHGPLASGAPPGPPREGALAALLAVAAAAPALREVRFMLAPPGGARAPRGADAARYEAWLAARALPALAAAAPRVAARVGVPDAAYGAAFGAAADEGWAAAR